MKSKVRSTVAHVNRLLSAHHGWLEVGGAEESGLLRVHFKGMCTGCPLRPLTLAATVRPLLLEVPGVTAVEMAGGRVSDEAQTRIDHYFRRQDRLPNQAEL